MLGLGGTLIGAGIGGLGSLLGGGQQTASTVPDAQTQQIRDAIFQQGRGIQSNPLYQNMLGAYGGFSPLMGLGIGALSGDQNAYQQFANPFIENVLKQSNLQFDKLGQQALRQVNDMATRQGAFGGSRAAVAQGAALSNLASQQALANSNLLYGSFQDAMNRAQQATQLGIGGNQAALGALGFPTSIYAQSLPGGGSTTTSGVKGGGLGGFLSGALGGAIAGSGLGYGGGGVTSGGVTGGAFSGGNIAHGFGS